MDEEKTKLKTGTTTVGISTDNAVVFAADKRATMGHFIAHKFVEKVVPVTDRLVMTMAGLVGDAQMLLKYMKSEIKLYELKSGEKITVKAAATLLGNIMYGNRFSPWPFYVQLLLGGYDDEENFRVYSLSPDGAVIIDKYIATGSGTELAYSRLDEKYSKDMTPDQSVELAISAVLSAIKRDVFSGENIDVFVITKDGYKKMSEENVASILEKIRTS